MKARHALLWIVCLALLAVGARNFEAGLSVDAPLYAFIARGIARSGEWFRLAGSAPPLIPFAEHPHLGLWLVALVFKMLPAADWSARIVGHVFYVAFLFALFLHVRRRSDERTAAGAVLLLWLWFRFANFFSNVYLDPGVLFFGALAVFAFDVALETGRGAWAAGAGVALTASAMVKGLTVLGFLPVLPVLWWVRARPWRETLRLTAWAVASCLGAGLLYYLAVKLSAEPDYFAIYWQHQWTNRFSVQWDWSGLWAWRFWHPLFVDTYWLPLALPALGVGQRPSREWAVPAVLFVSFVAMFAPAGREGPHYRLMLLPWLAWLVSAATVGRWHWNVAKVARGTAIFCVVAVVVLQYLPVRTHGVEPPPEIPAIEKLVKENGTRALYFDMAPAPFDFTYHDLYAWYSDLPMEHNPGRQPVPEARAGLAYLLFRSSDERAGEALASGWCVADRFARSLLFKPCPGHLNARAH